MGGLPAAAGKEPAGDYTDCQLWVTVHAAAAGVNPQAAPLRSSHVCWRNRTSGVLQAGMTAVQQEVC